MSSRFKDLTGQTFGERTVVGYSHQHPVSGNYYWKTRCSCGREDIVSGTRLRKGTMCLECSGRVNGRKGLYSKNKGDPVYFFECGPYIKVGSSKDVDRRLKDVQSDNPYDVILLWVGTKHDEEYWHNKLKDYHHRGEWYYYEAVCEIVDV